MAPVAWAVWAAVMALESASAATPASEAAPAVAPASRPNILFGIADDWSFPHAGAYGEKSLATPTFDRLAREGLLFTHAWCAAPSCTPSRGAILTGRAVPQLAQLGNLWSRWPPAPQAPVIFTDLLQQAGYAVALEGKGWAPGDWKASGRAANPAGKAPTSFADFLAALPADQPFFYWFGSSKPHRPYKLGRGQAVGLDPTAVTVPPYWPDTPQVRSDICDYLAEVQDFDRQVADLLAALERTDRANNTLVIVTSDNGMPFPRAKATLYDAGGRMPLVARWPGRIAPGGTTQALVNLADLAPTFLELAGLPVPQAMSARSWGALLTNPDSPQALAGRDRTFFARERHANVRAGNASYPARAVRTPRYLYIRNFRPDRWPAGDPTLHFAVGPFGDIDPSPTKEAVIALHQAADPALKRLFDLCAGLRPAEELYDTATDPWQIINLAGQPHVAALQAQLAAELHTWMAGLGDPRAQPHGGDDRFDTYEYLGGPAKSDRINAKP